VLGMDIWIPGSLPGYFYYLVAVHSVVPLWLQIWCNLQHIWQI